MPTTDLTRTKPSRKEILDPASRIRKLGDYGSSVEIDKAIPIKRYYRSGTEMERQARVYYSEGQLDRAFILYNKFATLFIEKLPKHPEYLRAAPTDKARIKKLLKQAFPRAMELKDKLKVQFQDEKEELEKAIAMEGEEESSKREKEERERQARQEAVKKEREERERQAWEEAAKNERERQAREDAAKIEREKEEQRKAEESAPHLTARSTVATTSVTQSIIERDSIPQDQFQPEITPQSTDTNILPDTTESAELNDPTFRETPTGLTGGFVDEAAQPSEPESLHLTATDPNLAHVLPPTAQMAGMTLSEGMGQNAQSVTPSAPPPAYDQVYSDQGSQSGDATTPSQSATFNPVLKQPSYDSMFQAPYQAPVSPQQQAPPPGHAYSYFHGAPPTNYPYNHQGQVPAGQYGSETTPPYTQQMSSPAYLSTSNSFDTYSSDQSSDVAKQPEIPYIDRSTKPASLKALSTSSSWEDSEGYRTVIIPADVASQFEQVASSNTRRNIETCGILAGKLAHNTFKVTHIIVPKQKGKSDSCETVNEEELFDAQDKYDLITLGWIHTHPSQTAFMSSVDLHCHCSYQIMLDEAIAIVCAPKYSEVGMYMLTEPHGLNYITHCEQEGFHSHPKNPPLYEDCKHIQKDTNSFIQIVDLR